jgi:nucleoside-diphosphate-sugar epimerase
LYLDHRAKTGMRILITGANGFIGQAVCGAALRRGHEILRFVRRVVQVPPPSAQIIVGTLDEPPWSAIESFAPDVVLHLAWIASPAEYLTSPENERLLQQSQRFLTACVEMGVQHVSAAGTCLEYADSTISLNEFQSPLASTYAYSAAKVALYRWLETTMTTSDCKWTWFRIFYPYGPGEHPKRLPTMLIRHLAARQPVLLRTPSSVKDYLFIDDLAFAICVALEQGLTGPVNLGSGTGVQVRNMAKEIARLLGADPALVNEAEPPVCDSRPMQVADTGRLNALGWNAVTPLAQGLQLLARSLGLFSNITPKIGIR